MNKQTTDQEKAILVGVQTANDAPWEMEESLVELAALARTAGARVLDRITQSRPVPDSAYFIGKGKAGSVADRVDEIEAELVIFDCELSPAQQRNLESLIGCKVIDRTQLIFDIFAQRAETREGKIQVELAQLEYLLPRLTGRGVMMSRLGAGIGTRGPGETKLEVDRRRIKDRIAKLKREMDSVRLHREVQRKRRLSNEVATAAIVGYTNAGKSSLLNAVADANAFVEDKLFATLDPRSRKVRLSNEQVVIFTDTVGFVRRLPHSLVAAFRATLEEATRADIIVLVIDSSNQYFEDHMAVAKQVLHELNAADKPTITVLNKIDLLADAAIAGSLTKRISGSVAVSARTGENIRTFLDLVAEVLSSRLQVVKLKIPQGRGEVTALVHEKGHVLETDYENGAVVLTAEVDKPLAARLREFMEEHE